MDQATRLAEHRPPSLAVPILRDDHHRLQRLLSFYTVLAKTNASPVVRRGLVTHIRVCTRALITVKEELLYPLLAPSADRAAVQWAQRDHALLCAQLRAVAGHGDDSFAMDQHMGDLITLARAYMAVEEERLFPLAEAVDSLELGARVAARRLALLDEPQAD